MPYKVLNPFTGKLDYVSSASELASYDLRYLKLDQTTPQTVIGGIPVSVAAAAPAAPTEGLLYVNSVTNTVYIYYGGAWQALHVLVPAALEFLLMESGDSLLMETGDKLALE
jgi:hypothetical protein